MFSFEHFNSGDFVKDTWFQQADFLTEKNKRRKRQENANVITQKF